MFQRLTAVLFSFLFSISLSFNAEAQLRCADLLSGRVTAPHSQTVRQDVEIRDLRTFGQAMTEGMLLRPEQGDLFEIYRKIFFGDPNTSVNDSTLKTVTDVLKKHPELQKPPFREYEIETVRKVYDTPESLAKYLKSQNTNAGQVRFNLFQIEANLGSWKKLVGYEDLSMPEGLTKEQKRSFQEQQKARFLRYLDRIISKENRDLLKDEKADYRLKIKTLYSVLKRMSDHMERRGRDNRLLRQAMVDLIATTGFNNQATQSLLKSKNALDKIEGLKKVLDERDAMAMELGFAGHFEEMLNALKIDSPSLSIKPGDETRLIQELERDVLNGSFQTLPSEKIRVRSLSIQESPFRSCLGGSDCSSRTYFTKALDPNFNYFTMTDKDQHSSGHVTVVLGAARDQAGKEYKVAFVDKLQNVPNQMIPSFLEAVRLSLGEQGYLLGIPENVGDHNGLSNMDTTRHFVANEVLPRLRTASLMGFTPHQNQYKFENKYSRAYDRLSVKPYEFRESAGDTEIRPGQSYEPRLAEPTLNKQKLVEDLINLRESNEEQDVLKYIASGQIIGQLEKLGLFSQKEFLSDLTKISSDTARSFSVRKQAFFEILLITSKADSNSLPDFQGSRFSDTEKAQMISEVKQWKNSSDKRKKQFADGINEKWFKAARDGNEALADGLVSLRLVDINQKNHLGFSALFVAAQNHQLRLVEKLLADPKVNVLEPDGKGFTVLDHALALGHQDIVQLIRSRRPDIRWTPNERAAARVHQTMDFVRVEGGTFKMGDAGVQTTISKPVDIMSTLFTQKMYLKIMGKNPAKFKEGENAVVMKVGNELHKLQPDNPIESISYEESVQLIQRINDLSKQDDPLLYELIPGHKKGAQYDFITEAQIEYVMKKAKTEDGDTIDEMLKRNDIEKLKQYVVFSDNSSQSTQPVNLKKPLFVDGKPIYDINGNVWVWVKDWYQSQLSGGVDPQGPSSGSSRVMRGGGWGSYAQGLRSASRSFSSSGNRNVNLGLRLMRTSP